MLKSVTIILIALAFIFMSIGPSNAQDAVTDALKGCSAEFKNYCSSVTPGGGRLVSCAKAHEDKLSSECVSALNRASYILQFMARTLSYVVSQCSADAVKFCPNVELGDQRVLNCLAENKSTLSSYCVLALKDIGK